jgi:hypothetical protein
MRCGEEVEEESAVVRAAKICPSTSERRVA